MLMYIANLPFDIRTARIRKLLADECRIDDVILDNLINDNCGKRITVGLVDEEEASIVMAKLNGYVLDGRKLEVEHVQKRQHKWQNTMKPFVQQPFQNYNTMRQPNNTDTNIFNTMPYSSLPQTLFGNAVRQSFAQVTPFPSFNKQVPGNWYSLNSDQQYGQPTQSDQQRVQIEQQNQQKRSYDSGVSDNPEKRQRSDYTDSNFGSYGAERGIRNEHPPSRSRQRDHDRYDHDRNDRFGRNNDHFDGRDRYDDSPYYDDDNHSFNTESSFGTSNRNDNRRTIWEQSPHKQNRRRYDVNNPPKPLLVSLPNNNNAGPNYKDEGNFNKPTQYYNNPHQNYSREETFSKPKQNLNKSQQYSNKPHQNINKQQNFNQFNNRKLKKKDIKGIKFYASNQICVDLAKNYQVAPPALRKLRSLCMARAGQIMEQYNCTSVNEVREHYMRMYPKHRDNELQKIMRGYPKVYATNDKGPQNVPKKQSNVLPSSSTSYTAPAKIPHPTKPSKKPQLAPGSAGLPALQAVPADQKLPKYPNADKNVYRELVKKQKLEAQDDFLYDVDKKYLVAIDYELQKMREVAVKSCKSSNSGNAEKIRVEILNGGVDKVMKAIRLQLSKRLVNVFVASVRIHFTYKPPSREALEKYLKDYNVISLKKSDRFKFYVATLNNSDAYDKLVAMGSATIGGVDVKIKPLNLLGKQDKKEKLTKYQQYINQQALKFTTTNRKRRKQIKKIFEQELYADDVEIFDKKEDIIEIKDDCDYSDDIIEIIDFSGDPNVPNQEQGNTNVLKQESENTFVTKQESEYINVPKHETNNPNVPKPESKNANVPKLESENTFVTKQESEYVNVPKHETNNPNVPKPESENTNVPKLESENTFVTKQESEYINVPKQETNNPNVPKPESENTNVPKRESESTHILNESEDTQIQNKESKNPTQESDNKIEEESINTYLSEELNTSVVEDDLEDF